MQQIPVTLVVLGRLEKCLQQSIREAINSDTEVIRWLLEKVVQDPLKAHFVFVEHCVLYYLARTR